MFDKELVFVSDKELNTAFESDAIDFKTKIVTVGQKPMYVIILPTEELAGEDATVTFILEDSADNSTFAPVLSTGALKAADIGTGVAVPLPAKMKRYLRLKTAVSESVPTAGKATVYIFDKFTDPVVKMLEGVSFDGTV